MAVRRLVGAGSGRHDPLAANLLMASASGDPAKTGMIMDKSGMDAGKSAEITAIDLCAAPGGKTLQLCRCRRAYCHRGRPVESRACSGLEGEPGPHRAFGRPSLQPRLRTTWRPDAPVLTGCCWTRRARRSARCGAIPEGAWIKREGRGRPLSRLCPGRGCSKAAIRDGGARRDASSTASARRCRSEGIADVVDGGAGRRPRAPRQPDNGGRGARIRVTCDHRLRATC